MSVFVALRAFPCTRSRAWHYVIIGAAAAAVAEGVAARCRAQGRPLVDARRALPLCAEFFDDAIHPSPEGSVTLANEVHTVICRRSF